MCVSAYFPPLFGCMMMQCLIWSKLPRLLCAETIRCYVLRQEPMLDAATHCNPRCAHGAHNPTPQLTSCCCCSCCLNSRTSPLAVRYRSALSAAMQPLPAAVIAWRHSVSCRSPAEYTPATLVAAPWLTCTPHQQKGELMAGNEKRREKREGVPLSVNTAN